MEYLQFLKSLHDAFIGMSETIVFDKEHPRQLVLVALYGRILELCGGLITLMNKKFYTSAPSLFRSLLEAYVELKNLYSDAEYGYFMEASLNDQWLKVLREAKKGNPYLSEILKGGQSDTEIEKHKCALKRLKDKGYKALRPHERFKKANMEKEYRSLYNFLSCDAHSNIRALINRHLDIQPESVKVVFYKDDPIEHHLSYLDSTADVMVHSSSMVHKLFKTGQEALIEDHKIKLDELRIRFLVTQLVDPSTLSHCTSRKNNSKND